uniref:Uncharacterized protein n=1 Tax=Anguilla anguilla TaxID=7936 RepID=A0A0E9QKK5_ANGAN
MPSVHLPETSSFVPFF